jgi:hypothetical protein
VNFSDRQLQKSYDLNLAGIVGSSEAVRQVCALIAMRDFFRMMEGAHSPRVYEIMERLLSPAMRRGLREWYRQRGSQLNGSAADFRDQLSVLAGEKLELG